MGTEIIVAIIGVVGSIVVALIGKSAETGSQSKQTDRRYSSPTSDTPQTHSGNPSPSRATVEQGAGTSFLISWVCACTAGWTMGWTLGALFGGANPVALNVISGLIIGVAQWYVLQNKLRESGWWILATAISGGGAGFTFAVLGQGGYTILGIIIANIVGGLFAGMAQWLILQQETHGAGYWVMITVVAWVMGGTVGNILMLSSGNFAIGGIACGAIIGLITGSQLVLLLNRPH